MTPKAGECKHFDVDLNGGKSMVVMVAPAAAIACQVRPEELGFHRRRDGLDAGIGHNI